MLPVAGELGHVFEQVHKVRDRFVYGTVVVTIDDAAVVFLKLPFERVVQRQRIVKKVTGALPRTQAVNNDVFACLHPDDDESARDPFRFRIQ